MEFLMTNMTPSATLAYKIGGAVHGLSFAREKRRHGSEERYKLQIFDYPAIAH